ncbi:MAG: TonB-dependent receptor [Acidobacteriota bacterium]
MKSLEWKPVVATLLLSVLLLGQIAYPDDLDNLIFTGEVKDNAQAVIISAKVQVRNLATHIERQVETDTRGQFKILVSEPGRYEIKVSAEGFKEATKQFDTVTGRKIVADFILIPAGITEQMVVQAATGLSIDTTRTVAGDTVDRKELESLPILNRDPLQLIFLLGGASEAPLSTAELADEGRGVFLRNSPEEAGIFSLTGAPATSNNITIDGFDNNDDRAARERIKLSPENLAEMQIITNQYAAEYGRASGGRINLRTRSGGATFHGEAYSYFSDESLNANTYFRNARGLGRIPQSEYRNGAVFSGHLINQKNFFFVGFERLEVSDFAEINTFVPTQSHPLFALPKPNTPFSSTEQVGLLFEEISTPETNNTLNARADFNLSNSHTAALRFDLSRGENKRGFSGGSRLAETLLIAGRNSDSLSFTDNWILSNHLISQMRAQFSRLLPRSSAEIDSIGVIINEPSRVVAGAFTGSDSAPAFSREERRGQIQDNLSLIRGAHFIKTGFDVQLVRSTFNNLFATGGQYTFETVDDFLANRPSRFIQRFDTTSRARNNVIGLFVQDEWRIKPNLTLAYGARWDSESILNDRNNFSPRLAIAWDPFGGALSRSKKFAPGKTLIRAGFGLFYNRALLRTIDDFSLGKSSITVDSNITPDILSSVQFPNPILDNTLVQRYGVVETDFLRRISPDLEIPYTLQTGIGIERQLSKNAVVTIDYIFTRGMHLWRETNINAPRLPAGFASFTEYLLSRDFDNRPVQGARPIINANADIVRFDLGTNTSTASSAIQSINGIRLLTLGLNTQRSSNLSTVLRILRNLRPDPSLTQVELLESTGNSFYHGGIFSLRYRLSNWATLRTVYTLSKFIDEGTTNTASPQNLSDRRAERSLSLQDQRHRFTLSGIFQLPKIKITLAPIFSLGSARPFNIGAGFDRNLNDIANDRPNFISEIARPVWRKPNSNAATDVKSALALAPLGSDGNLPRNYGRGPGTFTFNIRASRTFHLTEQIRLRPAIDVFNVLNHTVFNFGSEFVDRDDADFLVPRRTQRPRTIQLNVKVDF